MYLKDIRVKRQLRDSRKLLEIGVNSEIETPLVDGATFQAPVVLPSTSPM
jgi:hypothetical protein